GLIYDTGRRTSTLPVAPPRDTLPDGDASARAKADDGLTIRGHDVSHRAEVEAARSPADGEMLQETAQGVDGTSSAVDGARTPHSDGGLEEDGEADDSQAYASYPEDPHEDLEDDQDMAKKGKLKGR